MDEWKLHLAGRVVKVRMSDETAARLAGTCFRGTEVRVAGNFCRWTRFAQVFAALRADIEAGITECLDAMLEAEPERKSFDDGLEIEDHDTVGWSGTDERTRYDDEELEGFQPSDQSTGLRLREHVGRLAPHTRHVTFVLSFVQVDQWGTWVVHVMSVYPGPDVGKLRGDVTLRTGRIFLGWSLPGEPLPPDA